jgi:hypothetical protein
MTAMDATSNMEMTSPSALWRGQSEYCFSDRPPAASGLRLLKVKSADLSGARKPPVRPDQQTIS